MNTDIVNKCGFTVKEWDKFTKQQHRILMAIHVYKQTKEEIIDILEINPATWRFHWANIRRKIVEIRRERAERDTAAAVDLHKDHAQVDPEEVEEMITPKVEEKKVLSFQKAIAQKKEQVISEPDDEMPPEVQTSEAPFLHDPRTAFVKRPKKPDHPSSFGNFQ